MYPKVSEGVRRHQQWNEPSSAGKDYQQGKTFNSREAWQIETNRELQAGFESLKDYHECTEKPMYKKGFGSKQTGNSNILVTKAHRKYVGGLPKRTNNNRRKSAKNKEI